METHVLVDFENVQPDDFQLLRGDGYRVVVFLGRHQAKLGLDVVQCLQPLGPRVRYVQADRAGKNAVDFLIAFELGGMVRQLARDSSGVSTGASFVIVSNDGGFDALLSHARSLGCEASRAATIAGALAAAAAAGGATRGSSSADAAVVGAQTKRAAPAPGRWIADVVSRLVANFRRHPKVRPGGKDALERHVLTVLGGKATASDVKKVVSALKEGGFATVADSKVEYHLD